MARARLSIALGLVVGIGLSTRVASAADPDLERARGLFEEAGELERQGKWGPAQERLRSALRLRETPQLHYALGWALENDDKLLEAKAEYEITVKTGQNRSGSEEATRLAISRLADLDKKMPIIKVHVGGGARSTARVTVDGKDVKREDDVATTQANPGSHVIRVEGGTDGAIEQMVYVGRNTVRSVDVDTGDAVAVRDTPQDRHGAPAVRVRSTEAPKEHPAIVPWVLLASGAALFAGGTGLVIAAGSDASSRDDYQAKWCTETACVANKATRAETPAAMGYRQSASDATSSGNTKEALGFTLLGVGLVTATIGTVLLLRAPTERSEPVAKLAHVSATPLPGGAFAATSFAF